MPIDNTLHNLKNCAEVYPKGGNLKARSQTEQSAPFTAIAYYRYHRVEDPQSRAAQHRELLQLLRGQGRIYISEEGINAQVSIPTEAQIEYSGFVEQRHGISNAEWNTQPIKEHIFPNLTVKVRPQLVALNQSVQIDQTACKLEPREWEKILRERSDQIFLLDARNQIEWDLGHFEGAVSTKLSSFRDFGELDKSFGESVGTHTPILMYCTGGIRCECYSALLRKRGYQNLYQLKGGILNYAEKVGSKHWTGRLFVFDERLSLEVGGDKSAIASCRTCKASTSGIFNCANADCNALFFSCDCCWQDQRGCCCTTCQTAARLRPLSMKSPDKPFGKWHTFSMREGLGNAGSAGSKPPFAHVG